MEGNIYLRSNRELIALQEESYATEDLLQSLLADHPGLLAGDQVGDTPRRWVLLSREVGIADEAGVGVSITSSSIKTRFRHSSRSSGAQTPEFAAKS